MSEYIESSKESQVWLKIHSESEVTKITEYLADSSTIIVQLITS